MTDWGEKLRAAGEPVFKPSPRTFADVIEGQRMMVPTAQQVDAFIRSIPPGIEMDVRALRTALAIEHGAEVTCPVTIGYHLRTVAEAAHEQLERGAEMAGITPFWRVLNAKAPTMRKLSFGAGFTADRRKAEGLGE